jgi:tetratricopeptide (TPR) repeat protein
MRYFTWLACAGFVMGLDARAFADVPTTQPAAPVLYLAAPGQFPEEEKQSPLLVRELARQALLIAARDELGLQTRDAVLREWEPAADGHAPADALGLPALLLDVHRGSWELKLRTQLFKLDGRKTIVSADTIDAPNDKNSWASIPIALSNCEAMSRGKDLKLLTDLGFNGPLLNGAVKPPCSDPAPAGIDDLLYQTTLMAPFSALQQTHAAIHDSGESPERLGALVRAYANLGQLTHFQWSSIHVVLTARSLLYAQRMIHNDPQSPFSYYHRAYAYAMCGLPAAAMADLSQAHALEQNLRNARKAVLPAPDWAELLEPFCKRDIPRLVNLMGPNDRRRPLEALMVFVDVENCGSLSQLMAFGEAALQVNGSCFRIIDGMTKHAGVASGHELTEMAPQVMLSTLPDDIKLLNVVPASVSQAIAAAALNADHVANLDAVCESFLTAAEPAEPSFALAGRMLQETNFVHVVRRAYFMANMWGVDCSEYVQQVRPLIADHPLRAYVESLALAPGMRADYLKTLEVNDPQFQMLDLLNQTGELKTETGHMTGEAGWNRMWAAANGTSTDIEPVFLEYGSDDATMRDYARRLLEIDPWSAVSAATLINLDWPSASPHVDQWLKQFPDQPLVLSALGKRYMLFRQSKKADAILNHLVDVAPDREYVEQLASFYLGKGDEAKWLATLKRELDQPDYGLDHSIVESEIAWHYMNTGQYALARPWADASLNDSGSGSSMECDSMAAEFQGDYTTAEQLKKDEDDRYGNPVWYEWCKRSGRGDATAAQKVADKWIGQQLLAGDHSNYTQVGNILFLEHHLEEAEKVYQTALVETDDVVVALQLADICAELKDGNGREAALHYAVDHCVKTKYGAHFPHLVEYVQLLLAAPEKIPEHADVNAILAKTDITTYEIGNILYFRGRQFELAGETDKAKGEYEQVEQIYEIVEYSPYLFACNALHRLGQTTEVPKFVIKNLAPATQSVESSTQPTAATQSSDAANGGVPGNLVFAIKGEATIYLNGRKVGASGSDSSTVIPTSLQKGDLIVIRARSSFVYRAFALAFIPEDGQLRQFAAGILPDGAPEKISVQDASGAQAAPKGRSDGGIERALSEAGVEETVRTFGLPDKGKWTLFAVVVP